MPCPSGVPGVPGVPSAPSAPPQLWPSAVRVHTKENITPSPAAPRPPPHLVFPFSLTHTASTTPILLPVHENPLNGLSHGRLVATRIHFHLRLFICTPFT